MENNIGNQIMEATKRILLSKVIDRNATSLGIETNRLPGNIAHKFSVELDSDEVSQKILLGLPLSSNYPTYQEATHIIIVDIINDSKFVFLVPDPLLTSVNEIIMARYKREEALFKPKNDNPFPVEDLKKQKDKFNTRRSGQTTRLVDKYVQMLFETPNDFMICEDHHGSKNADRNLVQRIITRLRVEHKMDLAVYMKNNKLFIKLTK